MASPGTAFLADERVALVDRNAATVEDLREVFCHVEAVFALARRDAATLDVLVSGIVRERCSAGTWRLVERFRDRLTGAAFDALAKTADAALEELR